MRPSGKYSAITSLALLITTCIPPARSQGDPRQAAISLEQQGKTIEAEAAWETLSKAYPSNPEPFAHLGLLEARQEHYTEAIRDYRKAMAIASSMPGLRLNLGLALFKNGDYKQAIQVFEPLLKAQPDDQRLIVLMGMSHYGLGEYPQATPFLKTAAEHDAQNLTLLLTLAHSCLLSKQFPCVQEAFHRIVALNAESAEADMLMGEALDEMHETIAATRELRAAVAANPKEPNVHFGLGYLLWTQAQYEEAAQQFQAEIDNDPNHLQALRYLADAEIQLSRFNDARPLLEKLIKIAPENSMEHRDLGIVYSEDGQKKEALQEFQTAARLSPSDVNVHWRMGGLYRSMGKRAEAEAEFEKAKNLNKAADDHLLQVMSRIPGKDQKVPTPANTPADR